MQQRYHCKNTKFSFALFGAVLATVVSGCSRPAVWLGFKDSIDAPRIRMSCYATDSLGTVWADPNALGHHCYESGRGENNGILYTCRAGHIDTPHVRKAADWTKYLAGKTIECLRNGDTQLTFKFWEPSRYYVTISYPPNWDSLPAEEKERIEHEVALPLGQYLAFNALTWHEILTWFGYRPTPWYREFPSAFSWEDTFSNLMGTRLAVQAMRDTTRSYDDAMTIALDEELQRLGVQPKEVAIRAAKSVRGWWYTGKILFLVDIRKRNIDIGLGDGLVTASIVPDMAECPNAEPASYPVPTLDVLSDYGFSAKVEIEPRELEKWKIRKIAHPDRKDRPKRIDPTRDFAPIMARVRQDAIRKFGPEFYPEETAVSSPQQDSETTQAISVAPAAAPEQDGQ